jgi:hypothetical protein
MDGKERISAMPARANLRPGGGALEEELAAHLDEEDEAGPWRFPSLVDQALDELGWSYPALQAIAVSRAYAETGPSWAASLAFSGGSFGALAVHTFFPAQAVLVAVVLATSGVVSAVEEGMERPVEEGMERLVEFHAVLNQERALTAPPDTRAGAAEIIGLFTAPVRGAAGLVLGLLPLAVHTWPVDGLPQPWEAR